MVIADYVLHLNLRDLIAAMRDGAAERCYLQRIVQREVHQGIAIAEQVSLTMTAPVIVAYPADTVIHAIRIEVDQVSLLGHDADIRAQRGAVNARVDQLEQQITTLLRSMGILPTRGVRVVPGVWADLQRFNGQSDLWEMTQDDPRDPQTRRVVWHGLEWTEDEVTA